MNIRINNIEIKNFKSYHDARFDFSNHNTGSDLNIVIGGMGAGKSNILRSILWALYGENNINHGDISNHNYIDEDVCVQINFENMGDTNEKWSIKRTSSNNLSLMKKDVQTNKNILSENPQDDINKIIPRISITTVLSNFYEFGIPLIIDAPFFTLDKNERKNVLNILLDISKKNQVIIFMFDQEQTIMEKLTKNANAIYRIEMDDKSNTNVKLNTHSYKT